jgi:hypothetical protein
MDPLSCEGESLHGKKMTPIVIIDPCVEIVNPTLGVSFYHRRTPPNTTERLAQEQINQCSKLVLPSFNI